MKRTPTEWFSNTSPAVYKEEQRKAQKYADFQARRPAQFGVQLRRDYSEPLGEDELGDLSPIGNRHREFYEKNNTVEEREEMAGVASLIDVRFPSMYAERLAYLSGSKNPETEKAFLDYQYLLGTYQKILAVAKAEPDRKLAEQSYFDQQREKWADMTTSIAGPGNYENRKNQARQRFEGLMRTNNTNADRSPDYEWLNESDDEDVFEDMLN